MPLIRIADGNTMKIQKLYVDCKQVSKDVFGEANINRYNLKALWPSLKREAYNESFETLQKKSLR